MPAASWALRPAETIISRESEKKSIPTHHHYGPVDNSNLTVLLVPKQRLEQQLTQQKKQQKQQQQEKQLQAPKKRKRIANSYITR